MINFERTVAVLFAAGLVLLPLPGSSRAGCRHVKVVAVQQQAIVAYQPAVQPYYWSVGANLQEDAAAQRIANKVMALLAAQPQQLTAPPCPTCPTPQTLPLTAPSPYSLLAKNCQGCHQTNKKAQAAFDMSDLTTLTCEQKLACIAAVVDGRMPKGKQMDAQTLGDLIGQLSGAETAPQ